MKQRWQFSVGFGPTYKWELEENCTKAIHEHLKICAFNRDVDKTKHEEPVKLVHDVEQSEGITRKELMAKRRESRKVSGISPALGYWMHPDMRHAVVEEDL